MDTGIQKETVPDPQEANGTVGSPDELTIFAANALNEGGGRYVKTRCICCYSGWLQYRFQG